MPDTSPRFLIVEDDPSIVHGLELNLRLAGYTGTAVGDADTALEAMARTPPDFVLLDITLPRMSGLELLEQLRGDRITVPVIVLSARQDEVDKVAALRLGADDYVTKPFGVAELMARIDAVLRRAGFATSPTGAGAANIRGFGKVVVDTEAREVRRDGHLVSLTHLEFELLGYLMRNPGRVVSRETLLREVWGVHHTGSHRTVDNFIAQLRSKLERRPDEPEHLVTVRGSGYRFDP